MKSLKEALLNRPKTSEIAQNMRKQTTIEFLSKTYNLNIKYYELIEKSDIIIVNVKCDVFYGTKEDGWAHRHMGTDEPLLSITNGAFKFGKVDGDFIIVRSDDLTSLEGAPHHVGGKFKCFNCSKLKSLKGAPKYVGDDFRCCFCKNLESLEGAPKYVGGHFDCSYCDSLKTLKGAPEKFCQGFNCSYCGNLTSLEGAPKIVAGNFNCDYCISIKNLKGAPEKIGGDFECKFCYALETLQGDLKSVKNISIIKSQIENLVGIPYNCQEIVLIDCRKLTSFEGVSNKTFIRYSGCPVNYFAKPKRYKRF